MDRVHLVEDADLDRAERAERVLRGMFDWWVGQVESDEVSDYGVVVDALKTMPALYPYARRVFLPDCWSDDPVRRELARAIVNDPLGVEVWRFDPEGGGS